MNAHIVIDVESNGPCPGKYSMVSLGLATVNWELRPSFQRVTKKFEFAPVGEDWDPEAYSVIGVTYKEHCDFMDARSASAMMHGFLSALKPDDGRIVLWSDNPGFDFQWLNYYLHVYASEFGNVHGHSCRRIGDLWAGLNRKPNDHSSWKSLRQTSHTHDPVDDAVGNAEALEEILRRMKG